MWESADRPALGCAPQQIPSEPRIQTSDQQSFAKTPPSYLHGHSALSRASSRHSGCKGCACRIANSKTVLGFSRGCDPVSRRRRIRQKGDDRRLDARIRGPGGPKAVGCRAIMRPRRLMGTSCRPPIGWSQRGPGVRRPRVPSGLRETASPVPKCISSGVCPRKPEGARARLRIWLARRGIRGYECSGCGRRTWQVRDVRLRTWDDQVACSRLDELCTIICRTPDNNSFSSELPARRTRESEHLHYAYNRRVAGSNPA